MFWQDYCFNHSYQTYDPSAKRFEHFTHRRRRQDEARSMQTMAEHGLVMSCDVPAKVEPDTRRAPHLDESTSVANCEPQFLTPSKLYSPKMVCSLPAEEKTSPAVVDWLILVADETVLF